MPHPSPRAVRRAVDTLAQLGPAALAVLIERLDVMTPDPDMEPDDDDEEDNQDCCGAGDDDPASSVPYHGVYGVRDVGDPLDAEPDDDAELNGPPVTGLARCRPVRLARAA